MKDSLNKSSLSNHLHPWRYLALTIGLTWLLQFAAVGLQERLPKNVIYLLTYFGSSMVLLIALGLMFLEHDPTTRRDYRRRLTDYRRISWRWIVVIFLLEPLITGLSAWIDLRLGGFGIRSEALTTIAAQPWLIFPSVLWWLLFGPLFEEPGWRGYALEGLQSRYNAVVSSLIVGGAWAVWHIPLTLLQGTWQAQHHPFGTPLFWFYLANLLLGSFMYTWVYNNTHRSILAAILLHFVTNAFGELFEISLRTDLIKFALFLVILMAIFVIWGPRTFIERSMVRNE